MLELVPITLKEANAFVERYHRHHKPVVGHKFSIAASDGEKIVGVAIVGRPVSRYLDNGLTLEVNRLCTDGTRNACSFLYSAAWRAARNLGYKKLITYILVSETGSSLKAAGWKCVGECGGKRWNGRSAPKVDLYPAQMNLQKEKENKEIAQWYWLYEKAKKAINTHNKKIANIEAFIRCAEEEQEKQKGKKDNETTDS